VGCSAQGCSAWPVPAGYQLGCWNETCEAFVVPPGKMLTCSLDSCHVGFGNGKPPVTNRFHSWVQSTRIQTAFK
jgi:hypothetical protein